MSEELLIVIHIYQMSSILTLCSKMAKVSQYPECNHFKHSLQQNDEMIESNITAKGLYPLTAPLVFT